MNAVVAVLFAVLAVASANPGLVGAPVAYAAPAFAAPAIAAPVAYAAPALAAPAFAAPVLRAAPVAVAGPAFAAPLAAPIAPVAYGKTLLG